MQIMPSSTTLPPQTAGSSRTQASPRVASSTEMQAGQQVPRQAVTAASNVATPQRAQEQLEQAVNDANNQPSVLSANLSFSIDQDSRRLVVKLIDNTTQDVIRQIPSEEFLRMSRAIQQMQGLLVKEVA